MHRLAPLALAASLCGCASVTEEPYERQGPPAPAAWVEQPAQAAATWPDAEWWKTFGSAELEGLIRDAQANNHDLRAAATRVAQARGNARSANAALGPVVTGSADAARSKSSGGSTSNGFSLGLQASYEVDVWGRNRSAATAADLGVMSSEYGREVVRLALTADVASTYFQLLSLDDSLRVAEDNLAISRRLLDLIKLQNAAGRSSTLDVQRQETVVASAQAAIPPLQQRRQVVLNALALLLGRHAGEVKLEAASLRSVNYPPPVVGVPSELAERRPDIRRAEADLRAAHANIAAARAALYPSLTLSAQGGFVSAAIGSLFDSGAGFASIGLGLIGTIFDGGQRAGQVDVAEARKAELLETYQQTVLVAFREVEDALSGVRYFAAQEQAQQLAVEHAREAYRLAELLYKGGASDFTTVLDAQRALLSAESAVDQTRFSRFASLVALYRGLGGGWQAEESRAAR
jgi:multidrug efflux system outer membrane protein